MIRRTLSVGVLLLVWVVHGQSASVATMHVIVGNVEMQRVDTSRWLPVQVEGIVGAGDVIRTDAVGRAELVFFPNGTQTRVDPNTIFSVDQIVTDGERGTFEIQTTLNEGRTHHRVVSTEDVRSTYEVRSAQAVIDASAGAFMLRQKPDTQVSVITIEATSAVRGDTFEIAVDAGFGARVEPDGTLSDIVLAQTFDELDAALDGCGASVVVADNRMVPVYLAPDVNSAGVGAVKPFAIDRLMGTVESQADDALVWYRLRFNGAFGWIQVEMADVAEDCAGLRQFAATHREARADFAERLDPDLWRYCVEGARALPFEWEPYVLQAGDTTFDLARRFDTSAERIQRYNCIAELSRLRAGAAILLPPQN